MDERFNKRFERMDERFNKRFEKVDKQFEKLDKQLERAGDRFDRLNYTLVTGAIGIIIALVGFHG